MWLARMVLMLTPANAHLLSLAHTTGFPAWGIPANGGLLFEIEVLSIDGKK
jgi:hypothetical protein